MYRFSGFDFISSMPRSAIVDPSGGSHLEPYKVIPARNYYGAYGKAHESLCRPEPEGPGIATRGCSFRQTSSGLGFTWRFMGSCKCGYK